MTGTLTTVVLLMSLHTGGNDTFNNQNYGLGIEYTDTVKEDNILRGLTYGIYTYQNSYNKQSNMLSISKQWKHLGLGITGANNYRDDTSAVNRIIVSPEITFKFNKYVRIKTSIPFGTLIGQYDVVNLQLTF